MYTMGKSLHCFFATLLPAGLLTHLRFSLLPLHGFQRPSVNHLEGLELGPFVRRQGLVL